MTICKDCKWFAAGETDGLMYRHLMQLNGRSPSVQDVIEYVRHNKDGMCGALPTKVQRRNDDTCSMFQSRPEPVAEAKSIVGDPKPKKESIYRREVEQESFLAQLFPWMFSSK